MAIFAAGREFAGAAAPIVIPAHRFMAPMVPTADGAIGGPIAMAAWVLRINIWHLFLNISADLRHLTKPINHLVTADKA